MLTAAASDRRASRTRFRPGMQAVMMERFSEIWAQIVGKIRSRVGSENPEDIDDDRAR